MTVADHVTAELQARGMPGFWSKSHALDCVLSAQVSLAPVRALGSVFFFRATPDHVCVSVCLFASVSPELHVLSSLRRGPSRRSSSSAPHRTTSVCLSVRLSIRPSVCSRAYLKNCTSYLHWSLDGHRGGLLLPRHGARPRRESGLPQLPAPRRRRFYTRPNSIGGGAGRGGTGPHPNDGVGGHHALWAP